MDYYYESMSWASFQREMQEVLDLLEKDALLSPGGNPIRNLLITMPPRHAKSFNATVNFPAYCLMKRPSREVMVSAYNNDLAATFGRGTRNIVADKKARKAFGAFDLSKDTRAVDFWKTTDGGAYYAVGLNGTTTGRGANLLEVDDPYKSREEADSTTTRRKIWDFYTSGLLSRLQPDRTGQPAMQIVTHTRWHPDDMAGRIIESKEFKAGEWLHLNYQALTKRERSVYISRAKLPEDDPRYIPELNLAQLNPTAERAEDLDLLGSHLVSRPRVPLDSTYEEALWPERFPVEWLRRQRSILGDRDFESLYQQNPYVLGGNIIKSAWFRRYNQDEPLPEFHAMAITVDTAFKARQSNDYSVFSVGGITSLGDIYLRKVYREKLEFPDLKRRAIAINTAFRGQGLRGMWIEDAASGQSLLQELRDNSGLIVLPWKPGVQDKVARANSVTPIIEAGRVFIPQEADWLDDWMPEIVSFPSAKNDDQVDSLVMLLDVLSRMVVVGMRQFDSPIGDLMSDPRLGGDLLFTGQALKADPKGWQGENGFDKALKESWKGWGM